MPVVVGADTGGTFTDLVILDRGRLRVHKVSSTPEDPSAAVLAGVDALGAADDAELRHGSTVGTNALLERKGARTALVTTEGFRDVLEIGRQARPSLYDIDVDRPAPLVERALRFEIPERVTWDGSVVTPLDRGRLERIVRRLQRARIESVAVGLLFSFANDKHERAVGSALRELGVPVSLSCDVSPEYREYERLSATVVNAYLAPVMARYLERLRRRVGTRLRIMQSGGGLASVGRAMKQPVTTIVSGPAAGVVGATRVARTAGLRRLITFDMGGTSTDVALVDGEPKLTTEFTVEGTPVRVPVLDIHTVGAGGGSIAYRDEGGALRVGPESAGSDPGPACYGRGDQPTVTDAQIVLGRIPGGLLGGAMSLDRERSRAAIARLSKELGTSTTRTAEGIVRVALATMERAVKVISLERGHDPRDYALVAYGGAGALHAVELARGLGMRQVFVPPIPGALSALGLALSDAVSDRSRTVLRNANELRGDALDRAYAPLARAALRELEREGVPTESIRIARSASLRYAGQAHELDLPAHPTALAKRFHLVHRDRFGIDFPNRAVEIVHLRVRATGRIGLRLPRKSSKAEGKRAKKPKPQSTERVIANGKRVDVPCYPRDALAIGTKLRGPAILTEYSSTIWIPPDATARVVDGAGLVLDTGIAKD